MKEFKVQITETLQRTITVTANNETEALEKISNMYSNEEIILDSDDFDDYKIEVI